MENVFCKFVLQDKKSFFFWRSWKIQNAASKMRSSWSFVLKWLKSPEQWSTSLKFCQPGWRVGLGLTWRNVLDSVECCITAQFLSFSSIFSFPLFFPPLLHSFEGRYRLFWSFSPCVLKTYSFTFAWLPVWSCGGCFIFPTLKNKPWILAHHPG